MLFDLWILTLGVHHVGWDWHAEWLLWFELVVHVFELGSLHLNCLSKLLNALKTYPVLRVVHAVLCGTLQCRLRLVLVHLLLHGRRLSHHDHMWLL